MDNMFEKATRTKLRFETSKGLFTIEDLWDLSLNSLDTIAKAVNKKLKEESEESFIAKKSSASTELQLKLEILKYIIEVKLKEQEERVNKAQRMEELATLENLLNDKKNESLKSLPIEEIQKRISELKGN